MSKRIVFFGGIGSKRQFGGELTKNKEILRIIREYGYEVVAIDSFGSRTRLHRLISIIIKLFFNIVFYPKSTFVFSTSFGNIYRIIKLLFYCPLKLRIIYWGIGGLFADRVESGYFDRKYLKIFHLIIVEGDKMKQTLYRCGFKNVIVKPNFKKIISVPASTKIDDGKVHFFFLSRITPQKGVSHILNCAKRLNQSEYKERFFVHFYGNPEPDFKDEFEYNVQEIKNVEYCGALNLQDWNNYKIISQYHFMLFPTFWAGEGFPGAVIDAYIAGTPIIASDWNFNMEFIENGLNGFVIPHHDERALYCTMVKAICIDAQLYEKMSKKCNLDAYKFDTNSVITREFITQIL